jgi:hypothetical protein
VAMPPLKTAVGSSSSLSQKVCNQSSESHPVPAH